MLTDKVLLLQQSWNKQQIYIFSFPQKMHIWMNWWLQIKSGWFVYGAPCMLVEGSWHWNLPGNAVKRWSRWMDGQMDGCPCGMHNCSLTLPNTTYMFLNECKCANRTGLRCLGLSRLHCLWCSYLFSVKHRSLQHWGHYSCPLARTKLWGDNDNLLTTGWAASTFLMHRTSLLAWCAIATFCLCGDWKL